MADREPCNESWVGQGRSADKSYAELHENALSRSRPAHGGYPDPDPQRVGYARIARQAFEELALPELLIASVDLPDVIEFDETPRDVRLTYTNHRGETARRMIRPLRLRWGSTEHHPVPQWLLDCWDLDRQDFRSYALDDCNFARN